MKDFDFPLAVDKNTGKSSVSLFFVYITFMLALVAVGYTLATDAFIGTMAALALFFGCYILYRMRSLDKVKFDLANKSFELEDVQEPTPTTTVVTTTEVKNEPTN